MGVLQNKAKTPLFSVEERVKMLGEATKDMENVNISDWQYNMTNTNDRDYPGLIVSEGRDLYLSVKDYNIDTATTIIKGAPSNFDELAGITTSGVETGGVVSISSSTVDYLSPDSGYRSYKNQATYEGRDADSLRNNSTRYYYNVPEIIETALNANGGVVLKDGAISSPEELMIFGLTNYAHGHIRHFFVVDTGTNYNNILNTKTLIHLNTHILLLLFRMQFSYRLFLRISL